MSKADEPVTLDVFLLTLAIPADLPDATVAKVRRALNRRAFAARLHALVHDLLKHFPSLAAVTATVSR